MSSLDGEDVAAARQAAEVAVELSEAGSPEDRKHIAKGLQAIGDRTTTAVTNAAASARRGTDIAARQSAATARKGVDSANKGVRSARRGAGSGRRGATPRVQWGRRRGAP